MARKRNPRVDKQVRSAIADLLETEVADPRLSFVTITEVEVTPDHDVATVYYSTLDPDIVARDPRRTGGDALASADDVADAFDAAAPRLRSLLGRRARLRTTPELRFRPDPVLAQAKRIDEALRRMDPPREVPPGTGGISADDLDAGTDGPTRDDPQARW